MPCLSWCGGTAQRRDGQLYDLLSVWHQCAALFHGKRIPHVFQIFSSLFLCASKNQESSDPRDRLEYSDPDSCRNCQAQICESHYPVPEKSFSAGLSVALLVFWFSDAALSDHAAVIQAMQKPSACPVPHLYVSCSLQYLPQSSVHAERL